MKITVIDTPRAMLAILSRPLHERPAALRELIAPMYAHVPMPGDPVDLRIVDDYLKKTGTAVAQTTGLTGLEILRAA